ncbi:MAG: PAS domain S-box protein [Nitrospirae bacterium]|nr:MAG: PAS domain S-box protein [Nitrospirota bacterium]
MYVYIIIIAFLLIALGGIVLWTLMGREKQLRQLESQNSYLRSVIDSANEGIYVTDRDRRFVLWNRKAAEITGYRSDEIIGRLCYDDILSHTDGEGNLLCKDRCPLERAMATAETKGPEIVYLRRKDGHTLPVEVFTAPIIDNDGEIAGGIEVFRDVSERLERERRLRDHERKLETVLDNMGDGVLFIDPDGKVALTNRAVQEMLGIDEDILGKEIFSLPKDHSLRNALLRLDREYNGAYCYEKKECPPEIDCPEYGSRCCRCWLLSRYGTAGRGGVECLYCDSFRQSKEFLQKPKEYMIKGKVFSVLSTFIEDFEHGEIWEVVLFRDVTFEKIDSAMKLAGATAHELRQPLQAILGIASLIKDGEKDAEKMKKYCDVLMKSCVRMDDIVERLSKITRYRLKQYADEIKILDIHNSSEKEKGNDLEGV